MLSPSPMSDLQAAAPDHSREHVWKERAGRQGSRGQRGEIGAELKSKSLVSSGISAPWVGVHWVVDWKVNPSQLWWLLHGSGPMV